MEILAPAGNMDMAKAAVHAGANAIYCGGKFFSARAYADNFSIEELSRLITYCHERDVKTYVTVNTIIKNHEMESAFSYVQDLYALGVDALILQDIGLIRLISKHLPDFEIHASTQMTLLNSSAFEAVEKLGINRVVLPRELNLEDIRLLRKNSTLELEVFAHGSLCVSLSGQCFLSSYIGGRSGNRGRCAQPCRMTYNLGSFKGKELWKNFNALDMADLCTIESIKALQEAGVDAIKIEGRMKKPDYVYSTVQSYSKAINNRTVDYRRLKESSHRNFTKGLVLDAFGEELHQNKQESRQPIGKIIQNGSRRGILFLAEGEGKDILEVISDQDRTYPITLTENMKRGEVFYSPHIYDGKINSLVYRVFSQKLRTDMTAAVNQHPKTPVCMKFSGNLGERPILQLFYNNQIISVEGKFSIETAQKKPTTKERIKDQLSKIGDEPIYILETIEVEFPDEGFLPVSEINAMRREAFNELKEYRSGKRRWQKISYHLPKRQARKKASSWTLEVEEIEDAESFYGTLNFFDRLIVHSTKNIDEINFSGEKYFAPGFLMETDFHKWTTQWHHIQASVDGIMAEDLGMVQFCVEREIPFITGQGLNITNNEALNFFQEKAEAVFLSKELSGEEFSDLVSRTDKPVEVQVYGPERVMQLRFCPYSLLKKCSDNSGCFRCEFGKGYFLEDKKGIQYAFRAGNNWYNLYSPTNSLLDHLEELKKMGIDCFRISLMGVRSPLEELKRLENWKTLPHQSLNHYRYFEGIE